MLQHNLGEMTVNSSANSVFLIFCAFSGNLSGENSKLSADSTESTFWMYRVIFFHWYPPKKLKYGKPRLGESTLT